MQHYIKFHMTSLPNSLWTKNVMTTMRLEMLIEFWNKRFREIDKELNATKPKLCLIVGTLLYRKNAQHDIDSPGEMW